MTLAALVRLVTRLWLGTPLPPPACRCMTPGYRHVDPACSLHGHEVNWD